ncbi:MAG: hypothetical protein ACKVY0_27455 [Prosthecobacter sp.]|uniref:hypothetical protein n=1 Tax=Prosthecobacter sp. TaxID=1965333 RepID=UPI0038FE2F81
MTRSSRQIFLLIVSYTALAIVWGWRLHADDAVPVKEDAVLELTRTDIATRLANAPKHLQQAAIFQLAMLPEREVRALNDWRQAPPEQRLRQLTVQQGPVHAPCPLNTALLFAELMRADAPLVDDSRLLVSASGERLEEPHKIEALELLASQAIDNNELSLALAIHERACESPIASWQNVLNLAEAARLARRPAAALRVVNFWLDDDKPRLEAAQREDALDLQTTLLLEGTRYAEAGRIVLDALRALKPAEAIPARLMQRAVLATHAAAESDELLPWIERQLRTYPDHQFTLEQIAAGTAIAAAYRHWLSEAAAIADLNQQTSIACDMFFRLAAAGETRVLARLHALATQIGRGKELSKLLTTLQTRPQHPISAPQLAQALATGNVPSPARDLLAAHLKASANDREGWRLLTQIDVTLRGSGSAPFLWESFLKRFPGDAPALRQLAQLQFDAAHYSQTLRTLQQIPGDQLDEATLRRIIALAIQLDAITIAHRAQQLLVESASHPAVNDVLALASLTHQHPDAEAAQNTLTEAVAKLPAQTAFHKELLATPQTGEASAFNTAVKTK